MFKLYVDDQVRLIRFTRKLRYILFGLLFVFGIVLNAVMWVKSKNFEVIAEEEQYDDPIVTGPVNYPEGESKGAGLPDVGREVSEVPKADFSRIRAFTASYSGSRIDSEYLDLIIDACNEDVELVSRVVAGSICESGMGRDVSKSSNFWGFFKGGDRGYDPDRATMAKVICESYGTDYKLLGENKRVTARYTGGDNTDRWMSTYRWSLNKMSTEDK